jgi:Arc/MetJ-type ribon-helix-helix transcriptional regulator
MMFRMKERVTISVEPELLEDVRAEVAAGRAPNVSAAVEAALRARGKQQALRESLDLFEAEYGPIGEEAREWARRELERTSKEISSSSTRAH